MLMFYQTALAIWVDRDETTKPGTSNKGVPNHFTTKTIAPR